MQLKKLLDSTSGLRFMIDRLSIHSSYSRKLLLDSNMMYDENSVMKSYSLLGEFYNVVKQNDNKNSIQTLQYKLSNLRDINNTLSRLSSSVVLDDVELFEVKNLALLSHEVKILLEKIGIPSVIQLPELEDVVNILDPDGLRIATFYIYDSYHEELATLRKQLKEKDYYQEEIYNKLVTIEDEVRSSISSRLKIHAEALVKNLESLAMIDINLAKALQMKEMGLCFPKISKEKAVFKGLFNPEVKEILKEINREYQNIDISYALNPLIIMGANMGGKTIVLKTLALCQYLFQFGFGIPASEAEMLIYDKVFCLTTDEQSINKGLSSFAAEMKNIDAVIKATKMGEKVLALIDEPARTTNPTEGTALVSSLIKLLQDKYISLVIVTHYNIKTYNNRCLRVRGLENGKMNYELVETYEGEVPHEALNIVESLGVEPEWINLAKEILVSNK